MNESTAQLLEKRLLGNKHAFPCGCVVKVVARYPGSDWIRTALSANNCEEHPIELPLPTDVFSVHDEILPRAPAPGALEAKWVDPLGNAITLKQLQRAMDGWLWKHKDVSFRYDVDGSVTVVKPHNPRIVAAGGRLIDRNGGLEFLNSPITLEPGDLWPEDVDPRAPSYKQLGKTIPFGGIDYLGLLPPPTYGYFDTKDLYDALAVSKTMPSLKQMVSMKKYSEEATRDALKQYEWAQDLLSKNLGLPKDFVYGTSRQTTPMTTTMNVRAESRKLSMAVKDDEPKPTTSQENLTYKNEWGK